jgi:uncharacterized membrane protein YjjP (DUF1212 family)
MADALPRPAPTSTQAREPATAEAITFVLQLGRALHTHGLSAHRLEAMLTDVSRQLGLEAQFFSTPTSIMAAFGSGVAQRTHLIRIEPGSTNLGHLAQLDRIARGVMYGEIGPADGSTRIATLLSEPDRWSTGQTLGAFVAVSVAVACLLRVGVADLVSAALLGLTCGLVVIRASRFVGWSDLIEPVAACCVSTLAQIIAALLNSGAGYATTVAGLVVLLPGLMFTTGLIELSTRHLSSGTARLSGALVTFLGLGFGVALGVKLGGAIGAWMVAHGAQLAVPNPALPWWGEIIGVLIAPLCFVVLLKADTRDTGWIVLAAALAYATRRFAGAFLGDELGAFLGALAVSAGSTIIARFRDTTPIVTIVPGLLILVPGSVGLSSVTNFSNQQVVTGVEAAFRVALLGVSLAAGLLAGRAMTAMLTRRQRPTELATGEFSTQTAEWTVSRKW